MDVLLIFLLFHYTFVRVVSDSISYCMQLSIKKNPRLYSCKNSLGVFTQKILTHIPVDSKSVCRLVLMRDPHYSSLCELQRGFFKPQIAQKQS